MARYIDAEDVLEAISIEHGKRNDQEEKAILDAWDRIKKIPSADVVEVVRCKDCKHCEFDEWDEDILCGCLHPSGLNDVSPNAFCSYGERRENNAE